ncbi:hypothetical protein MTsPCn3_02270 [Erythrobacter sp. MTPC3]
MIYHFDDRGGRRIRQREFPANFGNLIKSLRFRSVAEIPLI